MISEENLDIRTVTMGISLLDCADSDEDVACEKIYNKITTKAGRLVEVAEAIEKEYGIPIINKRISVTPIAMVAAASGGNPVKYAKALQRAADKTGVNFIGGYSALVHKGFSAGSYKDLTRVAWLNETMWAELFMENKENVLFELDFYINSLKAYQNAIQNNDMDALVALLEEGKKRKEDVDG